MSTKAPIFVKRTTRRGRKEKLRDILSSDMISSPLADFRHTIHIGSGGEDDIFGDISFLKGKFHLLPERHASTLSRKAGRYVSYELSRAASLYGEQQPSSPLLKNAISLPAIGGPRLVTLPAAPPKPPRLHLGDKEGEPPANETPLGQTDKEQDRPDSVRQPEAEEHSRDELAANSLAPSKGDFVVTDVPENNLLSNAMSLLSLHLDLGPSILDDVLQIMDKEQEVRPSLANLEPGPRCEILSVQ